MFTDKPNTLCSETKTCTSVLTGCAPSSLYNAEATLLCKSHSVSVSLAHTGPMSTEWQAVVLRGLITWERKPFHHPEWRASQWESDLPLHTYSVSSYAVCTIATATGTLARSIETSSKPVEIEGMSTVFGRSPFVGIPQWCTISTDFVIVKAIIRNNPLCVKPLIRCNNQMSKQKVTEGKHEHSRDMVSVKNQKSNRICSCCVVSSRAARLWLNC